MKDVATLAGVGLATVSRVVNGTANVTPDLARPVTEASRELGYRHDLTASSLRRADRKTQTIGLVLEDAADPFSSAVGGAAARRLFQRLDGVDQGPARHEIVPIRYLPRGSGEIGP